MRPIKFRAFARAEKKIYTVSKIDFEFQSLFLLGKNGSFGGFLFSEVELMQFTGLYDKNGKEIYEGDLFRIKDTYHSSGLLRHSFKRDTIFEVVYDKTGFVLKVVKSDTQHMGNCIGSFQIGDLIYFEGKEHEIIGNIYDNPELLEK